MMLPHTRRSAFTLIEALVVVTIISLLVALTAAGTLKLMAEQQRKNTDTTIQELASQLQKQWQALILTARDEPLSSAALGAAGNDPRRARVLHIKMRLNQEFPMSFAEAMSPPGGLPPKQAYVTALQSASPFHNQSSVMLLLALKQARRGVVSDPSTFLNSNQLVDRFGDGLEEVIDGWGNPIELFLWPTDCIDLNPSGPWPFPPSRDSLDPDGLLAAGGNCPVHPVAPGGTYHLEPVIGSAGPNGQWGLANRNLAIADPNLANDNIYSYRLRVLGNRGG